MWTPDLRLGPSPGLSLLIGLGHGAVLLALYQLGGPWLVLMPVALGSGIFHVLRDGLRRLPGSVERIWLGDDGWYLRRRDGREIGPCALHSLSRVDARFIRLSFSRLRGVARHHLVTAGMVGAESYRQLQVFLRWASNCNQPLGR